ncbi:MAG: hypothetical protein ABFQ82_06280 [Thermodesulfobacteriota bacterium]
MDFDACHSLLVRGNDFDNCRARVEKFFARNFLVKYDTVKVITEKSYPAEDPAFWPALEEGLECNRQKVAGLIEELQEAGFDTLSTLASIPQGYETKILHTITHLVDGFFGIDTCFYNLEEDSHGLSEKLAELIRESPANFQLITVACSSGNGNSNLLARIRKFEVDPPQS